MLKREFVKAPIVFDGNSLPSVRRDSVRRLCKTQRPYWHREHFERIRFHSPNSIGISGKRQIQATVWHVQQRQHLGQGQIRTEGRPSLCWVPEEPMHRGSTDRGDDTAIGLLLQAD